MARRAGHVQAERWLDSGLAVPHPFLFEMQDVNWGA
jgi:hypothetical protein